MKFFIDDKYQCYTTNPDGTFREVEDPFFDGKCKTFVEGFRCIPPDESYVGEDGVEYRGITPLKDFAELDVAQREYERQLLKELQENSIPVADLENAYREGVNSVYD